MKREYCFGQVAVSRGRWHFCPLQTAYCKLFLPTANCALQTPLQFIHLALNKFSKFFYISRAEIKFNARGFVNLFYGFGIAKL